MGPNQQIRIACAGNRRGGELSFFPLKKHDFLYCNYTALWADFAADVEKCQTKITALLSLRCDSRDEEAAATSLWKTGVRDADTLPGNMLPSLYGNGPWASGARREQPYLLRVPKSMYLEAHLGIEGFAGWTR